MFFVFFCLACSFPSLVLVSFSPVCNCLLFLYPFYQPYKTAHISLIFKFCSMFLCVCIVGPLCTIHTVCLGTLTPHSLPHSQTVTEQHEPLNSKLLEYRQELKRLLKISSCIHRTTGIRMISLGLALMDILSKNSSAFPQSPFCPGLQLL